MSERCAALVGVVALVALGCRQAPSGSTSAPQGGPGDGAKPAAADAASGEPRPSADQSTDAATPPIGADTPDAGPVSEPDAGPRPAFLYRGGPICPGPEDTTCSHGADTALAGFAYGERLPDEESDPGPSERQLEIVSPGMLSLYAGMWDTLYDAVSDGTSMGSLGVYAWAPWAFPPEAMPKRVRLRTWRSGSAGASGSGGGASVSVQGSLRDASGALLLATGVLPLCPGGRAAMAPDDDLGFTLRWQEADCKGCTIGGTGITLRTVAMVLTAAGRHERVVVMPGESRKVALGGVTFVFAVESARMPVVGGDVWGACGETVWKVHRDGLLVELNDDGTPKRP